MCNNQLLHTFEIQHSQRETFLYFSNGVVCAAIPSSAMGIRSSANSPFIPDLICLVCETLCRHAFMVFKCSISSLFVGNDDTSLQFVHETEGSNDDNIIHVRIAWDTVCD